MLDLDAFDTLTFDCYGTLIDWERGIIEALGRSYGARGVLIEPDALLEAFARHEAEIESGTYVRYAQVLAQVLRLLGREHGFSPSEDETTAFACSVRDWPAFPDSADALRRLSTRYELVVITNCDDDLFNASAERLGFDFDRVITAEQVSSYKPSEHNFEVALDAIGRPRERVLHVAQSLFHDHVPAKRLGLSTVWVDRRHDRDGPGATPPAEAEPDLVVPDMATLVELVFR